MPRKASNKPKRNPWTDDLYGTYEGPRGNPDQWRAAFQEVMGEDEAIAVLGADSPWSVLDLAPGSSFDLVKRAYRAAALKFHPDRNPGNEQWATEQFIRIKAAYVALGGKQ